MDAVLRNALLEGEKLGLGYTLAVPRAAAQGWAGSLCGQRTGSSIDFQDYREYQPGDDLRFIDWSIYARSDRLTVKLFREEITPHLDLLIDGSRSMNLEGSSKAQATARLSALLAAAASNVPFTRSIWTSQECFERLPQDQLSASEWQGLSFESSRPPEQAWEMAPPRLRRLGVRVFLSDLLWPAAPFAFLRRLREGAAALFVVQLLARDDAQPPEHGNLRVQDSETGEERQVFVDSMLADQYRANLRALQQTWFDACRRCGAQMVTLLAEEKDTSLKELQRIGLLLPA